MTWGIFAALMFVLAAGYFSGTETGMHAVNALRIRFRAEKGEKGAVTFQKLASNMEQVVATTLVGHNLMLYTATAIITRLFQSSGGMHPGIYATIVLTPVSFILAEVIPKDPFERRREALICPLAGSLRFFTWLLAPIVTPLRWMIGLLLSRWGESSHDHDALFSRQGMLFSFADASGLGVLTSEQRHMAQNIMKVEELTVADACRPLEGAATVSIDTLPRELIERVRSEPYTRLPVYENDPGQIIGTVNVFDLLCEGAGVGESLRPYVKPAIMIDRLTRLNTALVMLRSARQRLGIVVDGANTVGLVTINDLVYQIIGKLGQ